VRVHDVVARLHFRQQRHGDHARLLGRARIVDQRAEGLQQAVLGLLQFCDPGLARVAQAGAQARLQRTHAPHQGATDVRPSTGSQHPRAQLRRHVHP